MINSLSGGGIGQGLNLLLLNAPKTREVAGGEQRKQKKKRPLFWWKIPVIKMKTKGGLSTSRGKYKERFVTRNNEVEKKKETEAEEKHNGEYTPKGDLKVRKSRDAGKWRSTTSGRHGSTRWNSSDEG